MWGDPVRKPFVTLTLVAVIGVSLGGAALVLRGSDSRDAANYRRVRLGMSVADVQAVLGPGIMVSRAEVPGHVVAVNSADEHAADEQARRADGSPPTARNYPTRIKPIVEGNHILMWVNRKTGERTLVAFTDSVVCEKDFWDPNYL